jgi:hypothetical protein
LADGTLEVRGGQSEYTTVGSASVGSIQAIFTQYDTTRGLRIFSIKREEASTDKVYRDSTELTGVTYKQSDHTSIDFYKDVIFFANGEQPVVYHDITTNVVAEITGTPTPPQGPHIVFYKDRMFLAEKDTGYVWWSDAGLFDSLPETDFPALNFIVLGSDGDPVTGLMAGYDFLIAFTRNSYNIMTGAPGNEGDALDMQWQRNFGIGSVTPKAMNVSDRTITFLGTNRRVYQLTGHILSDLDEENFVQEYLLAFSDSVKDFVSMVQFNNELWIYVPKGSNPADGRILVYNPFGFKPWTVFEDIDGFAFDRSVQLNRTFVGSASGGYIWEQGSSDTDLGTGIAFELITRHEPLNVHRFYKKYRMATAMAGVYPGETLTVTWQADNIGSYTAFTNDNCSLTQAAILWGAETWGASPWGAITQNTAWCKFTGSSERAKEMRLKVSGNVKAGTRFLGYSLHGTTQPREYDD